MTDKFIAVVGGTVCLRVHRYRNRVTAKQVAEKRAQSNLSLMQVKELLEDATPWVLQMSHDGKEWLDVPFVEEPHPRST